MGVLNWSELKKIHRRLLYLMTCYYFYTRRKKHTWLDKKIFYVIIEGGQENFKI